MSHRLDLTWVLLVLLATAVGVWLGVSGPELSPIITEVPLAGGGGPGR